VRTLPAELLERIFAEGVRAGLDSKAAIGVARRVCAHMERIVDTEKPTSRMVYWARLDLDGHDRARAQMALETEVLRLSAPAPHGEGLSIRAISKRLRLSKFVVWSIRKAHREANAGPAVRSSAFPEDATP
jgi:hypothetical protein